MMPTEVDQFGTFYLTWKPYLTGSRSSAWVEFPSVHSGNTPPCRNIPPLAPTPFCKPTPSAPACRSALHNANRLQGPLDCVSVMELANLNSRSDLAVYPVHERFIDPGISDSVCHRGLASCTCSVYPTCTHIQSLCPFVSGPLS